MKRTKRTEMNTRKIVFSINELNDMIQQIKQQYKKEHPNKKKVSGIRTGIFKTYEIKGYSEIVFCNSWDFCY